jgi:hypothetical protein
VLAFADAAAEAERLTEREPALASEAALDDGASENENIYAGVAAFSRCILRHGEWRFRRRGPPGLDPRNAAGFQLGDDLVGDF